MNEPNVPNWIDYIEIRKSQNGVWYARMIGNRIGPQGWMKMMNHKVRASIEGPGLTPCEAIIQAIELNPEEGDDDD